MPDFLVTGASGTVGANLVRLLDARGASIRTITRHALSGPTHHRGEHVIGDLSDPGSVARALDGVNRVFLLTGGPNGPEVDALVAAKAARFNVELVVKLSVLGLSDGAEDPITHWHGEGEQAVIASGVPANFVRPGAFMTNALNWAREIATSGAVSVVCPDLPVAPIDPVDVAAVAFYLLMDPGPPGSVYPITGPEALTPREQIQLVSEEIDIPRLVVKQSSVEAEERFRSYGMSQVLAHAVVATMTSPEYGYGQTPLETVQRITGLTPRSFRSWAGDNRAAFLEAPTGWSA
jgi:uncharacterized protein YbjT (DUF2867 family)